VNNGDTDVVITLTGQYTDKLNLRSVNSRTSQLTNSEFLKIADKPRTVTLSNVDSVQIVLSIQNHIIRAIIYSKLSIKLGKLASPRVDFLPFGLSANCPVTNSATLIVSSPLCLYRWRVDRCHFI